ncbi:pilus assembly protein [Salmonella enterica subsp. enterica serovar Java]|uniref:Pilus assembly protein n=1 Tax=Salmonella enterica subsp. enterica serovar Java TaxID=224729 RepID=A0A5X0ZCU2_SALEB|nr:pilus assembly protein [Salmonella enterica subsp. enterica serovar Java]EJK8885997.1 type 4b pilus protein PilO2 [Salmonella enterica]HAF4745042.1 type 4b pilus protein PilO2 [Salmonella enterica]HDI1196219.1 type 4b pilus protein PilO2 [Salmonella enterica]
MTDVTADTVVVVTAGRRQWAAGLRWEALSRTPARKDIRQRSAVKKRTTTGRARRDGTVLTLTVRQGRRGDRVVAHGRMTPRPSRPVYSLAAAFSRVSGDNAYGVYRLDASRYVFLATVGGLPSVMADVTGTAEEAGQALQRFLAFNTAPEGDWTVTSPPDEPLPWEALTASAGKQVLKASRLKPVRAGIKPLPVLAGLALLGAVTFWLWPDGEDDLPPVLADVIPAATSPEPVYLPHPWKDMMPVQVFLARCKAWRETVPVALGGWQLTRGECSADGLLLVYSRQTGGTAAGFSRRAQAVFQRRPVINLVAGGGEGTVHLPWTPVPGVDEPVPTVAVQLMRVVSWYQAHQATLTLTAVNEEPGVPGDDGTPPPVQDWQEYTFTLTDRRVPEMLAGPADGQGIRISKVTFTLSGEGQQYETEGHIYAGKK